MPKPSAGPEDALVELQLTELVVVRGLQAHRAAFNQVEVKADLGSGNKPVLHARAVHAAEIGGEEGSHDAQIRREIQTDCNPSPRPPAEGYKKAAKGML
jgi:hypothetical protein